MKTIKIISNNQIKLNNISYYKIQYSNLYSLYFTYKNNNYSNLNHKLFKLPNPIK